MIGSDFDSDSWLVPTTPVDSDSDSGSDSAPLLGSHYGQFDYLGILQCEREKLNELSRAKKCQNLLVHC